jgi:hypothetical protein
MDFDAILKGKRPDIALQPDDLIFLPGSRMRNLLQGVLGVLPGIAQTAAIIY